MVQQSKEENNLQYTYTARQPIIDRNIKVVGYELLYRNGLENAFPDIDPDLATRHILIEQFLIRQNQILDDKLGFINFNSVSLLKKIPLDFTQANFIVEILETCEPDDELYNILKELKSAGYQVALDDFIPSEKWTSFYDLIDIIKFDLRLCSIPIAAQFIENHKELSIKYVAEKVETHEEFHQAKAAGFDLFQGYFFKKPEIIVHKKVTSSLDVCIRLCKAVACNELDFKEIESIISQDTILSFQLLNFVNTSGRITTPIHSFRQALAYLGEDRIRKFVSYTALVAINPKKPKQLFYMSLHRAKFFELLVKQTQYKELASEAYLCGMLSLIDGLLDNELESVLASLSLSDSLKNALTDKTGSLGLLLELAEALENGDWQKIDKVEKALKVDKATIISCELNAHFWLNELSE